MSYLNKVLLMGNIGKELELKTLPSGKSVCNFTLATTSKYTDKSGEKKEETTWHNITVFDKQAENCCKFLKKGSSVYIEGKIKNRSYEDNEGNTKYITEITASNVQFLDGAS